MSTFYMLSGEVDDFTIDFTSRLTGTGFAEKISATRWNWYFQPGLTGFQSGTATGGSAMQLRLSGTGAPATAYRVSGVIITTGSGRRLTEYFDIFLG